MFTENPYYKVYQQKTDEELMKDYKKAKGNTSYMQPLAFEALCIVLKEREIGEDLPIYSNNNLQIDTQEIVYNDATVKIIQRDYTQPCTVTCEYDTSVIEFNVTKAINIVLERRYQHHLQHRAEHQWRLINVQIIDDIHDVFVAKKIMYLFWERRG